MVDEPGLTVEEMSRMIAEGHTACTNGSLFTLCPYGVEHEKLVWQTGWLWGFKESGRKVTSLKSLEENAILQHYKRIDEITAQAKADGDME